VNCGPVVANNICFLHTLVGKVVTSGLSCGSDHVVLMEFTAR